VIQTHLPPLIYDAAALLAADRKSRRMLGLHARAVSKKRRILVPAPVLAQVWRDGGKQARLSWLLRGCTVETTTEQAAKAAGVLLGTSHTSDAVDAIVVATALPLDAHVVTSDVDELKMLAGSVNATLTLIPV
jgi:hypothetical protein